MHVLVTRPQPDAGRLAEVLNQQGHRVYLEPLFEVRNLEDADIDLSGVQALLFTSANGVRAFRALRPDPGGNDRNLRVFTVGDASARNAVEGGFERVESAGGDVEDLIRLVIRRLDPSKGALFHVAGSRLAGDLQGGLEAASFPVRRGVVYETRELASLSAETRALLRGGQIDAVTFFSPRTARSFVRLICEADLESALETSIGVCLSEAVKAQLESLRWGAVRVASEPTQDALVATLDG